MTTQNQTVVDVNTKKPALNLAMIQCKITGSRFHDGNHYTSVVSPAPDLYSKPSQFQIRSKQPLGNPGTPLTIKVHLSGYISTFGYVDKNTGEQKTGEKPHLFLDLVE